MDKMREEFEDWHNSIPEDELNCLCLWDAWQASRQALVVELPAWDDYDTPKAIMITVKGTIDELGIKWTE